MLRHSLQAGMAVFALFGLAASLPCQAQLTFYSDRPSFLAATTGNTTIDFEGIAADNNYVFVSTPPGITLSGVNFTIDHSTGNDGNLYVPGKNFYYPGNSVLSSQESSVVPDNLVITLPTAETAIGLDIGSFFGTPIVFTLSDGSTFVETPPMLPYLSFVGFTDATPITSLTLTQPAGDVMDIDNFTFGPHSAVPEPGTYALIASLGLTGAAFLRRRRRAR